MKRKMKMNRDVETVLVILGMLAMLYAGLIGIEWLIERFRGGNKE